MGSKSPHSTPQGPVEFKVTPGDDYWRVAREGKVFACAPTQADAEAQAETAARQEQAAGATTKVVVEPRRDRSSDADRHV